MPSLFYRTPPLKMDHVMYMLFSLLSTSLHGLNASLYHSLLYCKIVSMYYTFLEIYFYQVRDLLHSYLYHSHYSTLYVRPLKTFSKEKSTLLA